MTTPRLDLFTRTLDWLAAALASPEDAIVRDACIPAVRAGLARFMRERT
jgi:hypothetical protein